MKASNVDGDWEMMSLETDAVSVEAGKVQVDVPEDGKAAFYKFGIPEKQ